MAKKKTAPYVVIRSDMYGVVCGVLARRDQHETELHDARIVWEWQSDAGNPIETVHDLATKGVGSKSKVSAPVASLIVRACPGEGCLSTTAEAEASLRGAVWAR